MKHTHVFSMLVVVSLLAAGCSFTKEKAPAHNAADSIDLSDSIDNIPAPVVEEMTNEEDVLDTKDEVKTETDSVLATMDLEANGPVTLQVGQVAEFTANGMSVTVDSISSDGEVKVSMNTIYQPNAKATLQLPDNSIADMGGDGGIGYQLRLDNVMPAASADESTATFTFIVSEGTAQ